MAPMVVSVCPIRPVVMEASLTTILAPVSGVSDVGQGGVRGDSKSEQGETLERLSSASAGLSDTDRSESQEMLRSGLRGI